MDINMTEVPHLTLADLDPGDVFEFIGEPSFSIGSEYGTLFMKLLPAALGYKNEHEPRFVGLTYYDTWVGFLHNPKRVRKLDARLEVTRND